MTRMDGIRTVRTMGETRGRAARLEARRAERRFVREHGGLGPRALLAAASLWG